MFEEELGLLDRQLDLLDKLETVFIQNEYFSEGLGDTAIGHEESKDPKMSVDIWLHVGVAHPPCWQKLLHCFVSLSSVIPKLPIRSDSVVLACSFPSLLFCLKYSSFLEL